jgi:hypothetical protein
MNDEFERIWKKMLGASLRYYHNIFLDGLRKSTNKLRTTILIAEILVEHFPNTSMPTHLVHHLLLMNFYENAKIHFSITWNKTTDKGMDYTKQRLIRSLLNLKSVRFYT